MILRNHLIFGLKGDETQSEQQMMAKKIRHQKDGKENPTPLSFYGIWKMAKNVRFSLSFKQISIYFDLLGAFRSFSRKLAIRHQKDGNKNPTAKGWQKESDIKRMA